MPRLSQLTTSDRSSVHARSTSLPSKPVERARMEQCAPQVLGLDGEQACRNGDRIARGCARQELGREAIGEHGGSIAQLHGAVTGGPNREQKGPSEHDRGGPRWPFLSP